MEKKPHPTVDERVTAYRWVIQSLPEVDDAGRNLLLQGKRPEAIMRVIDELAIELHKRVAAELGAPSKPALAAPAMGGAGAQRSTVTPINSRRERA